MAKATAKVKEPVVEEVSKTPPIMPSRVAIAESARNQWRVAVPVGTDPEACLDQEFWQHTSNLFGAGDEVIILSEDMAWRMDCMVMGAGKNYASLTKLALYDLEADVVIPAIASDYKIEWGGIHYKWRVLRKGVVLRTGIETKTIAARYAQQHENSTLT